MSRVKEVCYSLYLPGPGGGRTIGGGQIAANYSELDTGCFVYQTLMEDQRIGLTDGSLEEVPHHRLIG